MIIYASHAHIRDILEHNSKKLLLCYCISIDVLELIELDKLIIDFNDKLFSGYNFQRHYRINLHNMFI